MKVKSQENQQFFSLNFSDFVCKPPNKLLTFETAQEGEKKSFSDNRNSKWKTFRGK